MTIFTNKYIYSGTRVPDSITRNTRNQKKGRVTRVPEYPGTRVGITSSYLYVHIILCNHEINVLQRVSWILTKHWYLDTVAKMYFPDVNTLLLGTSNQHGIPESSLYGAPVRIPQPFNGRRIEIPEVKYNNGACPIVHWVKKVRYWSWNFEKILPVFFVQGVYTHSVFFKIDTVRSVMNFETN